jgi:outer membrane receptor protein involved in Fe transport
MLYSRVCAAAGVRGTLTTDAALAALLAGSGFTTRIDGRLVAIVKAGNGNIASAVASNGTAAPGAGEAVAGGPVDYGEGEEIVVTGTNIRGQTNETLPLTSIDSKQIERSGYSTVQEVFRTLPQNFVGGGAGASEDGRFGTGSNAGLNYGASTGVNLRGLGNSSTLVLLDGRRVAPTAFGQFVDISLFPLTAVDGIDIVTDGSSAVYGSDAVAGVVNIKLRDDFSGFETRARFGGTTEGGRREFLAAQTAGHAWSTGNAVATVQYQKFGDLNAQQRTRTNGLSIPNEILPETDTLSAIMSLNQNLSESISLFGNAIYSRRRVDQLTSFEIPGFDISTNRNNTANTSLSTTGGLAIRPFSDWTVELTGQYARNKVAQVLSLTGPFAGSGRSTTDAVFEQPSGDIIASGSLFSLPGGRAKLAAGGSFRQETLRYTSVYSVGFIDTQKTDRKVWAGFGEIYLPILSPSNHVPAISALDISASIRYDHYSDFGSTTNPRVGVRWSPLPGLNIRGAYSTAFRAPSPLEVITTGLQIQIDTFETPSGPAPVFVLFGARPLRPETAKTYSLGLTYEPTFVSGLRFSANYYDIAYRNRIESPPLSATSFLTPELYGPLLGTFDNDAQAAAFLTDAINQGAQIFDRIGAGAAGVTSFLDVRLQNVAVLRQSGFDLSALYTTSLGGDTLSGAITYSHINKIKTAITAESPSVNVLNTLGNPTASRVRADVTWSGQAGFVNAAANYVNGYTNNSVIPFERVSSWPTFDVTAQLNLGRISSSEFIQGLSLTFAAQNVFDKKPPLTRRPDPVQYDPANANVLGRILSVEVRKSW